MNFCLKKTNFPSRLFQRGRMPAGATPATPKKQIFPNLGFPVDFSGSDLQFLSGLGPTE